MHGQLVVYQDSPVLPLFIADEPKFKDTALLCIAGMGDGLLSLPYLETLHAAKPEATLVQILLSSSYSGWGLASLDDDATEIMRAVECLIQRGFRSVVLLGHSTGCQDTIHTILTQEDHPFYNRISAGILQAPVSDCEAFDDVCDKDSLADAVSFARGLHPEDLLPRQMMRNVGFGDVAMTARRWLSVATPGGQDDYFSSTLSSKRIKETFGRIKIPFMAIVGGDDEYVPANVDKEQLIALWKQNTSAPYFEKSFVLAGANHKVTDEGAQQALAWSICSFLKQL